MTPRDPRGHVSIYLVVLAGFGAFAVGYALVVILLTMLASPHVRVPY